jgi:ADP-ribose pyrophosphatase YjhB (NUDIX family)
MDGYYVLPGGHQHLGETVSAAAVRECGEETGVCPASVRPVCVLPYRSGRHQGLNFVFEAEDWPGEPVIGEPDLFDAAGWFVPEALPEPHAAWIPEVLRLRDSGVWFRELHWN